MKYRKKPIIVDAIFVESYSTQLLDDFCGRNWERAEAVNESGPDDEGNIVVWNTKEKQWLNLPIGHYLIRGIDGELYPCDPDIFEQTYEPVEESCPTK